MCRFRSQIHSHVHTALVQWRVSSHVLVNADKEGSRGAREGGGVRGGGGGIERLTAG